ncbi:MAG: UDP-N-acetylglucosamine 1-carboxyvinyltransferase, partial [Clostridiales bacterium]|nr:UDP-N-acetylglucosamine 1-carboxyvinyltransferase [Clostridiales bacterium]
AEGVTEIDEVHHIERGYENLVGKLSRVGADIRAVELPDTEQQSSVI